jgi:HK97 family phage major capsid protein
MNRDILNLPTEASLVSVAWTAEEGDATESEATFGTLQLNARRLDAYGKITNELLNDSAIDITGLLMDQFINAVALELDNQTLNGTGTPVSGILTSACGTSVQMSAGERMSNISADDLSNMIYQLNSGYLAGARYIVNRLGMHYIRTLKDTYGQYVFANPGAGVPGTIWEYPYFLSEKIANTDGTSKAFVAFGNFKKFYIGRRLGSMALDLDPYSLFTKYATQYRLVTRWGMGIGQSVGFCRLITGST